MAAAATSARTAARRPVVGPELTMIETALQHSFFRSPILLREPKLDSGCPDLVAVHLTRREMLWSAEREALTRDHFRVLHHLHSVRWSTSDDLANALHWGPAAMRRILIELLSARLIRQTRRGFAPVALSRLFLARRIVAIEAKMSDWRRALEQASANLWFASESYVLLPASRVTQ
jgi:hypothetical protein